MHLSHTIYGQEDGLRRFELSFQCCWLLVDDKRVKGGFVVLHFSRAVGDMGARISGLCFGVIYLGFWFCLGVLDGRNTGSNFLHPVLLQT